MPIKTNIHLHSEWEDCLQNDNMITWFLSFYHFWDLRFFRSKWLLLVFQMVKDQHVALTFLLKQSKTIWTFSNWFFLINQFQHIHFMVHFKVVQSVEHNIIHGGLLIIWYCKTITIIVFNIFNKLIKSFS